MKFYQIGHGDSESKRYAWAGGYGPLPNMPFLGSVGLERRRKYWEVNPSLPGLEIDSGSSRWPDILGCGHSPPSFFTSGRVRDGFRSLGVEFAHITPVPIAEIASKKLRQVPAPDYYVLQARPGIDWDFAACGVPLDAQGKAILDPQPKPWPPPLRLKRSSWNGMDVVTFSNWSLGHCTLLFCTERIVELAEREKWTNVRFDPVVTS